MRCKSFKIHKLSFWLIIAIAIVAANLSASEAEGAVGSRFVVERRSVVDSAPFYAALFNPTMTPETAAQYGTRLGMRDAFANALGGVLTADRGGRDR